MTSIEGINDLQYFYMIMSCCINLILHNTAHTIYRCEHLLRLTAITHSATAHTNIRWCLQQWNITVITPTHMLSAVTLWSHRIILQNITPHYIIDCLCFTPGWGQTGELSQIEVRWAQHMMYDAGVLMAWLAPVGCWSIDTVTGQCDIHTVSHTQSQSPVLCYTVTDS